METLYKLADLHGVPCKKQKKSAVLKTSTSAFDRSLLGQRAIRPSCFGKIRAANVLANGQTIKESKSSLADAGIPAEGIKTQQ